MKFARITGTGGALPGKPISNAELIAAKQLDSSPDWIEQRTGIQFRHLVDDGRTTSDLALEASQNALSAAGKSANAVDLIIVATSTPDFVFPSVAALLQAKLGITNGCPAFDVQAVCSGFSYALTTAEKFIRSGSHQCALVVGADIFSRILDWSDRRSCVLFGDGAGAVLLEASTTPGILASAVHADGRLQGILSAPGQVHGGQVIGDPFLRMDGQAVFKVAINALFDVAEEVISNAGLSREDVDWLIPHQANMRIIQMTAKKLGIDESRCIATVIRQGNTSAASIPLALDYAIREGMITPGQRVLLAGVGGGFTWGGTLLTL
jgi:3-oxoacyl-[acyl-carrier-protein] synthase-3